MEKSIINDTKKEEKKMINKLLEDINQVFSILSGKASNHPEIFDLDDNVKIKRGIVSLGELKEMLK